MKKIIIGTNGEGFDMDTLLPTRALIQANSGGGKSYLIRRIVEQLFGKVQLIIVDPEGEFATLREKYDFVLVGKGGETPADPRSAALLAEKLLELNASAICDIYELKAAERHRWVRIFLDALVNAPKNLWHPVVIIVDEAHVFAPEKGQGESEAIGAMTDLATRGRKRGFCLIAATQRLGKFSKNVSAELQNVLIGSTFQDIDRKRAAETLGVLKSDEREFFNQLRVLEPGNFFALGRAISTERIKIKIAPVSTSHPQSGAKYKSTPPEPSEKIKALLPSLADLPAEAEEKARTFADLKQEIVQLKRQLKSAPLPEQKIKEVAILKDAQIKRLEDLYEKMNGHESRYEKLMGPLRLDFINSLDNVRYAITGAKRNAGMRHDQSGTVSFSNGTFVGPASLTSHPRNKANATNGKKPMFETIGTKLPPGEEKILAACIQFTNGLERSQLTVLTGYKRSSRDAYIARLKEKGFVTSNGDSIHATEAGIAALPHAEPLPQGKDLQDYWLKKLPAGENAILLVLLASYPNPISRDEITKATNYMRSSRDAYLSRMAAKELVNFPSQGMVYASDTLFEK